MCLNGFEERRITRTGVELCTRDVRKEIKLMLKKLSEFNAGGGNISGM